MLESTLKEIELRYDNSDRKIFDDFRVPTLENAKPNVKNFFYLPFRNYYLPTFIVFSSLN